MTFNKRTVLIAAGVIGLAVVLVAGIGFRGRGETMASRSAAAFREALRKGEPVNAGAHGHGALSPETKASPPHAEHGDSQGGATGMPGPADMPGHGMSASRPSGEAHAGYEAEERGRRGEQAGGHAGMQHRSSAAPAARGQPEGASSGARAIALPQAKAVQASPGQPAATLRPDPLDQPAETSVADATRSAEMARETGGGHGMQHGATSYRQLDAGRDSVTTMPEGEGKPPGSSVTPKTTAQAPHHHGMRNGSPQPSPTPAPRAKPPSSEKKPSTPPTAPTHPPHHHSGVSIDAPGKAGGSR
jgi:hypothetical protein